VRRAARGQPALKCCTDRPAARHIAVHSAGVRRVLQFYIDVADNIEPLVCDRPAKRGAALDVSDFRAQVGLPMDELRRRADAVPIFHVRAHTRPSLLRSCAR
jgi:hypothetical protein